VSSSACKSNNCCSFGVTTDSVEEGSFAMPRGCDIEDVMMEMDSARSASRDIASHPWLLSAVSCVIDRRSADFRGTQTQTTTIIPSFSGTDASRSSND